MNIRGIDVDQVQDILAFRIIVNNITECYKCLGVIHSCFKPIPGRFKDYVAIPKVNGYQSLHTTVFGLKAEKIEIQIRTLDMDQVAESGIAAHWKYKEGIASGGKTRLDWVEELLEFNRDVKNNDEFMFAVKNDLEQTGIFIFTPNGDVKELKYGATPLDFAYAIHTDVGHKCIGVKVNGKIVSLRYVLKSGDTVEVLTSKNQRPSKDWLGIVKSSKTKAKIKQWFMKIEKEKRRDVGKEILEKSLSTLGITLKSLQKDDTFNSIIKELKVSSEENLYYSIGSENISTKDFIKKIPNIENENINNLEIESLNVLSNEIKKQLIKNSMMTVLLELGIWRILLYD